METIVRGDGKITGIGPMAVAAHEGLREHKEEQSERDEKLKDRVSALESNAKITAAWVGGAVFVVLILYRVAEPLLNHLLPVTVK